MNVEKINKGLARIVSVKPWKIYQHPYVAKRKKNRVFTPSVLHKLPMTDAFVERNKKGFVTSKISTVAHAPSLYYWLFHRCGVAFAETNALISRSRLKVNGTIITRQSDMESQLEWSTFEQLDIQIRSSLPHALQLRKANNSTGLADYCNMESKHVTSTDSNNLDSGSWVSALKRALHRVYGFMYFPPHISLNNDESDPQSFIHRLKPVLLEDTTTAAIALNVMHPVGVLSGMRSLGVITNDVSSLQYWNNEFHGNYGVYDVRFMRGTPLEVIETASRDVTHVLTSMIKPQLAPWMQIPCSCTLSKITDSAHDWLPSLFTKIALHDWHLIVRTPLLPYRLVQRLRRNGGYVTLIRSGPFVLHPSLVTLHQQQQQEQQQVYSNIEEHFDKMEFSENKKKRIQAQYMRLMSPAEMAVFFTFERRLKTNRMLMTLHQFDNDSDNDSNINNNV